jgi:hypothetical protein
MMRQESWGLDKPVLRLQASTPDVSLSSASNGLSHWSLAADAAVAAAAAAVPAAVIA